MNIPNALTLLRIFFVPMLVGALVGDARQVWLALAIFLAAALTDLLDGYLARRWGQITTVGTLLDPIADKLLISAALIALVQVHAVAGWVAILIVGREFAISGLRSIASSEGYIIQASDAGKTKMVLQVVAVALLLVAMEWPALKLYADLMLFGVVASSLFSALLYFRQFWSKIDHRVKRRRRREYLAMAREQRLQQLRAKTSKRAAAATSESRSSAG
ncbi:MAG: CDP-diacylglycerol--glycerol-3-phosphate 3-phosphatidyltransferase [Acidobacteria bacterium]|nr:CDP-diacylglycerol--glycerol-3-phosphate 3-phosphatidyltransferase [Acidobacteriota bacterium]